MTFISSHRLTAVLAPALVVLAGCGSSRITGALVRPAIPRSALAASASASPSASAPPVTSLPVALSAADIIDSGDFSQASDGLLGGLASTDARVFTSADNSVTVEIDLVADTGPAGAAADYPSYRSAAAAEVGTDAVSSSAGLGQRSEEYIGSNSAGHSVAAIAFIEGRYIAVVTTVGGSTAAPDEVRTTAESIAQAQDNKINTMGS